MWHGNYVVHQLAADAGCFPLPYIILQSQIEWLPKFYLYFSEGWDPLSLKRAPLNYELAAQNMCPKSPFVEEIQGPAGESYQSAATDSASSQPG